jgi:IS30 family transposase
MKSYKHFTEEERECLHTMRIEGRSLRNTALKLGRSVSSVSRELARNTQCNGTYSPRKAATLYRERRKECVRRKRLHADKDLRSFVERSLDDFWSPQIIAERWKGLPVGHSTIYRALKAEMLPGYTEKSHLRRRGKRKYCRGDSRTIKPDRTIHQRPAAADLRGRIGDWEGDTVLGAPGKGGILTMIDRKSRYLKMELILCKEAETVSAAVCRLLSSGMPAKTITFDNGSEFARFREMEKALGIEVYFADTHSPWQRGSVENVNGLVRFFFPKGTDFKEVTPERVAFVEHLINNRPRKCLGWLSPEEFLKCCT